MLAADFDYFTPPFAAMAHRGGWIDPADEPRENTLHAFGRAVELGYGYLETDVRTTSDGVLMAVHDADLARVAGSAAAIGQLPYERLREQRINGLDVVPTLAEVLEACPTARLNIDIKEPRAITVLLDVLREHDALGRVCVASFSHASLTAFRRLAGPGIATSGSSTEIARAVLLPPLARRLNGAALAYQVPVSQTVRGVRLQVVTKRFIAAAHAQGKRVHVWTINDADEMHRLIDLGVDGLISDRIAVLKDVLIERELWT